MVVLRGTGPVWTTKSPPFPLTWTLSASAGNTAMHDAPMIAAPPMVRSFSSWIFICLAWCVRLIARWRHHLWNQLWSHHLLDWLAAVAFPQSGEIHLARNTGAISSNKSLDGENRSVATARFSHPQQLSHGMFIAVVCCNALDANFTSNDKLAQIPFADLAKAGLVCSPRSSDVSVQAICGVLLCCYGRYLLRCRKQRIQKQGWLTPSDLFLKSVMRRQKFLRFMALATDIGLPTRFCIGLLLFKIRINFQYKQMNIDQTSWLQGKKLWCGNIIRAATLVPSGSVGSNPSVLTGFRVSLKRVAATSCLLTMIYSS